MTDAYRDDLAYIHDAGFGGFARAAAPVLLDALTRRGISSGLVIDLGCGSGILSRAASEAGFDVLGIDISPAMVALAKQSVPRGQFRMGSLLSAELAPCVAVAAVGECFNYLFDPGNTRASVRRLFRRVYSALQPGGLFLFDVAGPGRVPGGGPRRLHMEGEDWAVLVTNEEDSKPRDPDPHDHQLSQGRRALPAGSRGARPAAALRAEARSGASRDRLQGAHPSAVRPIAVQRRPDRLSARRPW